ncbi:MAG: hypothetical protein QOG63_1061 [Thermoleophilaceae bacterium]|nr:hypothetical protein [Thermoleophilaceae bacterium]
MRAGSRVERERFADLGAALDAIEARGRELEGTADSQPVKTLLGRDYQPVQVVRARLELRGPGVRAGVDVRGDGSSEAFTGRVRRALVEQRGRESAYDALRRAIAPSRGS